MRFILFLLLAVVIIYPIGFWQKNHKLPFNLPNTKEEWRPYLVRYLGPEQTDRYIGEVPKKEEITLPILPKIKSDPTKIVKELIKKNPPELTEEKKLKYNYFFIEELYENALLRKPSKEEWENWYNALAQGSSFEGVYRGLVLGSEFRQMEMATNLPSKEMVEFTIYYLRTYLNLKIGEDRLSQLNSFQIKSYCTEKSLEVMDLLVQQNPKDLYRWYSVLSSDLAQKFKLTDVNGRTSVYRKAHYLWAEKMPIDFIKAELIIKLFSSFNRLLEGK